MYATSRMQSVMTKSRSATPAPLLTSIVALVLCGVIPILLWSQGARVISAADVFLTITLVLAGARFAWIVGGTQRYLHEMVLWLFVYVFLGAAPLVQLRIKFPGTTPNLSLSFSTEAALIVLAGCSALLIGSIVASATRNSKFHRPAAALNVERVNARNTYIWSAIALTLAVVYALQVGPENLFGARSTLRASQVDSLGADPIATLISAGARMGLVVSFVSLMHLRWQRHVSGGPKPVLLPLVVAIILFSVVNPISSARYTLGTALLAALGALGAYATVWRFRILALSALVGVVLLFPVLDTFRRSLDATIRIEGPLDTMTTGDFDAFGQIVNTAELVDEQGLSWGYQLLGPFFFWIPRSIWPDKPTDTGVAIAEFKGYTFQNLSAPLWSELFINFGWVGLVIGMLAVGFLLRRLDYHAEMALQISPLPGVMACITPFYLLILLRGSLLQAMVTLFVIVAVSWFVTRPERPRGLLAPTHAARMSRARVRNSRAL